MAQDLTPASFLENLLLVQKNKGLIAEPFILLKLMCVNFRITARFFC